jgi:uncharacterized protein (DUF58 family)
VPAINIDKSGVELTLQSLIDLRFDVQKHRSGPVTGGRDFPGQRLARRRGQGIEFLDLRQYADGDDVRHIDWNVTARTNEPYTRLYRQEKEQNTTVVADLRPVMFNGSECLRAVTAARLAAATLWQASEAGDRCSALVISSDNIVTSRPLPGNRGVLQALELIARGFEQTSTAIEHASTDSGRQPQLAQALDRIISNRRHGGRTFLFSGLDADADRPLDPLLLSSAAIKGLSVVLILDKLELQPLPRGTYRYRNQQRISTARISSANQKHLYELLDRELHRKQTALADAGVATINVYGYTAPADFLTTLQQQRWI